MKNFFEQQNNARKSTRIMLVLLAFAVFAIVSAVVGLAHFLYFLNATEAEPGASFRVMLLTGIATLTLIIGASLFRIWRLKGSGISVALMLNGLPVPTNTTEPLERRLLNVVEEMAIASGVPTPKVFVLKNEVSINAFAAGMSPSDAVIGVTQGTLEKLSRDELQGVVAHEFSHIFNGDMRLNLNLIGALAGILSLSTLGHIVLRSLPRRSTGRNKGGGGIAAIAFFGIGLIAIGFIGVFFARMIKAAVSRQREYLADAAAVQYTRNPGGIGGALNKIRQHTTQSLIENSHAEEASHLFFGEALSFSSLFATHPPINDRIKRVAPILLLENDSLNSAKSKNRPINRPVTSRSKFGAEASVNAAIMAEAISPMNLNQSQGTANVDALMSSIGQPTSASLKASHEFVSMLPDVVREAAHTTEGAQALLMALLLEEGSPDYQTQQNIIQKSSGDHVVQYALEIKKHLSTIVRKDRVSLLDLALPSLRELDSTSKSRLVSTLRELCQADLHYSFFEYVLMAIVNQQLGLATAKPKFSRATLSSLKPEVSTLLSAFSHIGAEDESRALEAFSALERNRIALGIQAAFFQKAKCGARSLEAALEKLRFLSPPEHRRLISACVQAIVLDQKISYREMELLRGIGAALDAPVPLIPLQA